MLRMLVSKGQKFFSDMAGKVKDVGHQALDAGALRLQKEVVLEIRRQKLTDRGLLASSVRVEPSAKLSRRVVVDAPYASALEYGARPFTPPIAPLQRWALRKGIAKDATEAKRIAWGIAMKYRMQGTKPRRFFRNALQRAEKPIFGLLYKHFFKLGLGSKGGAIQELT